MCVCVRAHACMYVCVRALQVYCNITGLYIFYQTEGYGAVILLSLICGVVSCVVACRLLLNHWVVTVAFAPDHSNRKVGCKKTWSQEHHLMFMRSVFMSCISFTLMPAVPSPVRSTVEGMLAHCSSFYQ